MAAPAWMLLWCDDRRKLPILAGLAPFIRPELGLLSALLLLRLSLRSSFRENATMALLTLLAAVPWAAWVFSETGQLIPSTIGAKLAWLHPPDVSFPDQVARLVRDASDVVPVAADDWTGRLEQSAGGAICSVFSSSLGLATATVIFPTMLGLELRSISGDFHPRARCRDRPHRRRTIANIKLCDPRTCAAGQFARLRLAMFALCR